MHEIRQVLVRMRMGESNRAIAKTGLIGRHKAAALRDLAQEHGWLEVDQPLPNEAELAIHFADKPRTATTTSLIVPYHKKVETWLAAGVQGTTIHQTLVNRYGFGGSYSSLRRYLNKLAEANPRVTTVIEFPPGDAAQIDFGAGPKIMDTDTGEIRKTWIFVMTLAWSRHMYAELIWDQSVATWLACHRRAFQWFNGLPTRVIIDNPKCAITKACYHDPEVHLLKPLPDVPPELAVWATVKVHGDWCSLNSVVTRYPILWCINRYGSEPAIPQSGFIRRMRLKQSTPG